jgi:hypothetical protein
MTHWLAAPCKALLLGLDRFITKIKLSERMREAGVRNPASTAGSILGFAQHPGARSSGQLWTVSSTEFTVPAKLFYGNMVRYIIIGVNFHVLIFLTQFAKQLSGINCESHVPTGIASNPAPWLSEQAF